jgi:PAS domain S-box-containing protein
LAEAYLVAMRWGGHTPTGKLISIFDDPETQALMARTGRLMKQFRLMAVRHFPAYGEPPPPASMAAETDHIYGGLIRAAEAIHHASQDNMDEALKAFRRDLMILMALSLLIGIGATLYVRAFERRKARYRAKLEQEIFERKRVQEGLDRAQAISHLGHWEWHVASGTLTCSDETFRILGVDAADLTRGYASLLSAVHQDDRQALEDHIREIRRGQEGEAFDHRVVRPGGEVRHVRAQLALAAAGSEDERVVGTVRDVTLTRQAEAAVAASEARYQQLFETMSQGMVLHDADGVVISANPAAETMLGLGVDEMTGSGLMTLVVGACFEDGTPLAHDNCPVTVALRSGAPIIGVAISLSPKEGGPLRWLLMSATPQFDDSSSTPTGVLSGYIDITEQRHMEEEYRQARRMEALGTLVGGIAHDFNNILTSLQGTLHIAQRRINDPEQVKIRLTTAEQLGHRAADMVNQLLAFSRQRKVALAVCDFTQVIQEGVAAARVGVPKGVVIGGAVPDAVLNVHGNANLLQQVLVNLVFNARDALEERGEREDGTSPTITITLGAVVANEALRRLHPDLPAGQCAVLSVSDNGCGIPQDHLEKLFEPFFTTKEVGRGTGLGLAMCYGTVRAHGGAMEVESVEGKGTTFRIFLPLAGVAATTNPSVRSFDSPRARKGETVLLADDEELVLLTAQDVLADLGYTVLTAADGEEACKIFNRDPDRISLALMDVVMPRMGGVEAVRRMRETRPDLPVIFATGYDRDSVLPSTDEWQPVKVLSKPYPMARIGWQVRELIDFHGGPDSGMAGVASRTK